MFERIWSIGIYETINRWAVDVYGIRSNSTNRPLRMIKRPPKPLTHEGSVGFYGLGDGGMRVIDTEGTAYDYRRGNTMTITRGSLLKNCDIVLSRRGRKPNRNKFGNGTKLERILRITTYNPSPARHK